MNVLMRGQICSCQLTVAYIDVTDVITKARKIFNLSNLSALALSRVVLPCVYLCGNLKNERDKVTLSAVTDGVAGKIIAIGDGDLKVKCSIDNSSLEINGSVEESLKQSVMGGRITLIKSMGLKTAYTGSAEIENGDLLTDFCNYFSLSEQQPTKIVLLDNQESDGRVEKYRAVFVRALPFAENGLLDKAEQTIKENLELFREKDEKALYDLFDVEEDYINEPTHKCDCSRKLVSKVLMTLGYEEIITMLEEMGEIELVCPFCLKKYKFNKEPIDKLFNVK